MENNPLLIIEENDDNQTSTRTKEAKVEVDPSARLKLAMKNKKLKEEFFRENEINRTTEIMNEDYENEIDKSMLDLEDKVSLTYSSDDSDDDESTPSNGALNSDDNGEYDVSEKSALRSTYSQQVPSLLLPFYERRRLSECIEESETDEESEQPLTKPTITVTSTNGITHQPEVSAKKRFVVTKANEDEINVSKEEPEPPQQPVSILKKTPSPPSQQKNNQSPRKIRYEAQAALRDVSASKNSQTIHFPCSPSAAARANLRSIFSPQGNLNPHLDKRYFDTSLVEFRTSQNQLITSTKSLDDSNRKEPLNDIWIKRTDSKHPNSIRDNISVSSDSITSSKSNGLRNDVRETALQTFKHLNLNIKT